MASRRIRVCVVEDHPLIREGIARLLEREGDLELTGQYSDGLAAAAGIEQSRPDVVATNVGIPGLDGLDLCRRLGKSLPGARVLIVTLNDEVDTVTAAFQAGARGYLLKEYMDELSRAVRDVAAGRIYLCPGLPAEVRAAVADAIGGTGSGGSPSA